MDEKKLMTIVNLGSAVMILVLAGAFVAVIRAAMSVGAHLGLTASADDCSSADGLRGARRFAARSKPPFLRSFATRSRRMPARLTYGSRVALPSTRCQCVRTEAV
jgi:hypothetical protein